MSRFSDMDAAERIAPMLIRGYHAEYPVLGWFFATMGIAGVTGLVRRD